MAQQWIGAMEDDQRLRRVAGSHVDGDAPGFSLTIDQPDLQVRGLAGTGRRVFTLPPIQRPTEHTIDDGHSPPPFRQRSAQTTERPSRTCDWEYPSNRTISASLGRSGTNRRGNRVRPANPRTEGTEVTGSKRLRPERDAQSPRERERGWGPASIGREGPKANEDARRRAHWSGNGRAAHARVVLRGSLTEERAKPTQICRGCALLSAILSTRLAGRMAGDATDVRPSVDDCAKPLRASPFAFGSSC